MIAMYENKGLTSEEKRVRIAIDETYNRKKELEDKIIYLCSLCNQNGFNIEYSPNTYDFSNYLDYVQGIIERYLYGHEINENVMETSIEKLKGQIFKLDDKNMNNLKKTFEIYELIREIKNDLKELDYTMVDGLSKVFDKNLISNYKSVKKDYGYIRELKTKDELLSSQKKLDSEINNLVNTRGILDNRCANLSNQMIDQLFVGYYKEADHRSMEDKKK